MRRRHVPDGGNIPLRMRWADYLARRIWIEGRVVPLSPIETEIMLFLMLRRGCLVTKEEIIQFVWPNPDDEPACVESNIFTHFSHLRRKLADKVIGSQMTRGYIIHKERN